MATVTSHSVFGIFLLFTYGSPTDGLVKFSLDGQWMAANTNKSIKIPATVPGGIYTDLKKSGVIGEPLYGFNDVRFDWIGKENWSFSRQFDVPNDLLNQNRVSLVAHGIDTVCNVTLNDVKLFDAVNMYVRYVADVKDVLRRRSNIIEVSCESPVLYALRKHQEQVQSYPVYPLCPPSVQNGQCHVNYIRKMPCSFSWDWGPAFPSTGIWKTIELEGYSGVTIRDVLVTTRNENIRDSGFKWALVITVFYDSSLRDATNGTAWISLDGRPLYSQPVKLKSSVTREARLDFSVVIPENIKIEPWWPSGYGDQNLYNLNVTIAVNGEDAMKIARFGFRTVELNQDSVAGSSAGTEFYFKINGVPIYAKGSNWIPADIFPERVTNEYIKDLLLATKEANMNMLRVWGGGVYESDYFYDLADELGILIWQDMMFAVSLYPVNTAFLRNVATEVQQQVRRLHRHPSIVTWAANNENEEAIAYLWWPQMVLRMGQYRRDYRKLYIDTIQPTIDREDRSRPFLSSSPSNGRLTPASSWISINPNSPNNGDRNSSQMCDILSAEPTRKNCFDLAAHYYNYLFDAWDPATFPLSRFVSEHGLQSYPSRDAFLPVAPSSMIAYPFTLFLQHRQHLRLGDSYLTNAIRKHFKANAVRWPGTVRDTAKAYDMISYLSQIHQAMGMRTAAETFRRWRSYLKGGLGHNMGFLYWQLNDIWQAPSWASIEYGGRWKMVHYYARKFFSPVIVSPYVDRNDDLRVFLINDKLTPIKAAQLAITQFKWASFTPVATMTINVTVPQAASFDAYNLNMENVWKESVCDSFRCFLWFTLIDSFSGNMLAPDTFLVPAEPKNLSLPPASAIVTSVTGPTTSSSKPDFKVFNVGLRTDKVALFVWLNAHNISGHFADNGFLLKDPTSTVEFYTRENVTAQQLQQTLTVNSLTDYSNV